MYFMTDETSAEPLFDPLLVRWEGAFTSFISFVEEASDMAQLVRQSVNNTRALDEAVEKSVKATFSVSFLGRFGDGIRSIVRHGFESRKSISSVPELLRQEASLSLDAEIEEMAAEFFFGLRPTSRRLFIVPKIKSAIQGVDRRVGGPRLYAGLLLQLDSAFEVFFGELITTSCLLHPINYNLASLGVTAQDIIRAEESEGVSVLFAEREAGSVLNRSINDWLAWFEGAPRKLFNLAQLRAVDEVRRFHLVRNVLAHGDGKPQKRHETQMTQLGMADEDFLLTEERFTRACRSYVELAYEVWALAGDKLFRYQGFSSALNFVQLRVIGGPYASAVAKFEHLQLNCGSEGEVLVNGWIAQMRAWKQNSGEAMRRPAEVREEVKVWQPDADSPERQSLLELAKLILLDDKKKAVREARRLYSEGVLDAASLKNWPLFEELDVDSVLAVEK